MFRSDPAGRQYYIQTCVDYKNKPFKLAAIDAAGRQQWLKLNVHFINGQELEPYAKNDFRLRYVKVLKRKDVAGGTIESTLPWGDPSGNYTNDVVALTDRVNKNLNEKNKEIHEKYSNTSNKEMKAVEK